MAITLMLLYNAVWWIIDIGGGQYSQYEGGKTGLSAGPQQSQPQQTQPAQGIECYIYLACQSACLSVDLF